MPWFLRTYIHETCMRSITENRKGVKENNTRFVDDSSSHTESSQLLVELMSTVPPICMLIMIKFGFVFSY